jgi:restriction system-associated AAA family ATPase
VKLLRLKLNTPFRNLQPGFEVHFLREWDYDKAPEFNPYCLVGRNGSGKSNILEALAAIFYHIECIYLKYRPDGFEYDEDENPNGFRADKSFPDAFELEYFFPLKGEYIKKDSEDLLIKFRNKLNAHIIITKEKGKEPQIHWKNRSDFQDKPTTKLSRLEVKDFLPKFVLGFSSGHNEILSLPFFKMRFIHFDEYKDILIKDDHYGQAPEGRLIYLDNQFSQAIVLCNFLMQPPHILKPFEDEIGISAIKQFRIIIRTHHRMQLHEDLLQSFSDKDRQDKNKSEVELTSKLKSSIEKLKKCSTTKFYEYDDETDSYNLYLDYWINDATREAFRLHFGSAFSTSFAPGFDTGFGDEPFDTSACSALDLFQTFQMLLTLNLYTVRGSTKKELYESESLYVDETVPTPPSDERIMRFKDFVIKKKGVKDVMYGKSLSDGEHQFLHAIGLCLLFKDEPALFLLDEPETHFNPDWRARLISSLRECLESDDSRSVMREMLIASHSPFIVSDCHEENVLVFKKDEKTSDISCTRPDFKTFGASVNQITIKAFEKIETIGGYAQNKLDELEKRFAQGEDAESLIKEANRTLGDSVEKVIFINKLLDKK